MKSGDYRTNRGQRREGVDPIWAEPNWDAPWHQQHALLPREARCETCLLWFHGLCGLTLSTDAWRVRRAEDRCLSWWRGAGLPATLEMIS
jgi:hypothetical protein